MKKKSLRRVSMAGLVVTGMLVFFGVYSQQNKNIKAMPEKEEQVTKRHADSKSLEKSNKPIVGSLATEDYASVAAGVNLKYTRIWLNVSEVISKTDEEIIADIEPYLGLEAIGTGGTIHESRISDVTTLTEESRGHINITAEVKIGAKIYTPTIEVLVLPNGVFGDDDGMGWENLPLKSTNGFLENPMNGAKIGFPNRGVMTDSLPPVGSFDNDTGFLIVDKKNHGYVYGQGAGIGSGRTASIPYLDNEYLYSITNAQSSRDSGLGWNYVDRLYITDKIFLRKGNMLKELLFDNKNQIVYVYDLKLEKNMNFSMFLSMYNLANTTKSFSMLEVVDTDFYTDHVPIYALGWNSGFYLKTVNRENEEVRFAIKLKNNGKWLSDYTKFKAIPFRVIGTNQFGYEFSLDGQEKLDSPKDTVWVQNDDTAYQLGAPPKNIAKDEALKVGYQVFAGNELPYMTLTVAPKTFNVYNNQKERLLNMFYDLTQIPSVGETGNVNITYPEGQVEKVPFIADQSKSSMGGHSIKLDYLPNEETGTIKKYGIDLLATVESESVWTGLPSNDMGIEVNVYNFGGTPVLKVVKKDSAWNKTAEELITDPVALPGHKITYEYADTQPDTSKTGIQWIEVRMTDQQDVTQTKIVKVPVLVVDGPLPTGLWINADDIYLNKSEVTGMTSAQIENYILENSRATGYDINTGLTKDIELSVTRTTLTGRPDITIPHTATIQASKAGSPSQTKNIRIVLIEDPVITAQLDVAKTDIKLGEVNTYTAIFKDEAAIPTNLKDTQFKTTPFPEYTTPDKSSIHVKMNESTLVIPPENIEFTTARELKIDLPEISAGAQVTISYEAQTFLETPPPSYPALVEQGYEIQGNRLDGDSFEAINSNLKEFIIFKATSTININYYFEDSEAPVPNQYPSVMSGNIGESSALIRFDIDNYVLTQMEFDWEEKELPKDPFTVNYGDVTTINFYYTGMLKIKSAPSSYDFDIKEHKVNGMKVTNPKVIGDSLVIMDTNIEKIPWNLKAKVTQPLQSLENNSIIIPSAIKYKNGKDEVSLNEFENTFFSEENTQEEYDLTKTRWSQGDGFLLDIPAGAVKSLGKYKAEIVITLENAY